MSAYEVLADPPPEAGEEVFTRTWPSRIDRKGAMVDEIRDQVLARGWVDERGEQWLVMCLEEALMNAIVHGNEVDPQLEVSVDLRDAGERWILVVRDAGDGFAAEDLPDPENPDSLFLEHGRGVMLMASWFDELRYYRHGATAWMAKYKPGHEPVDEV